MIDFINTTLSFDFLPGIIKTLKVTSVAMLITFLICIILIIFSYLLKNTLKDILNVLSSIAIVAFSLLLVLTLSILIIIPTMFCIVSLKLGIIEVFNIPELIAGLISSFFCIGIFALAVDSLVFKN